jgi:hypothetical protein
MPVGRVAQLVMAALYITEQPSRFSRAMILQACFSH